MMSSVNRLERTRMWVYEDNLAQPEIMRAQCITGTCLNERICLRNGREESGKRENETVAGDFPLF